MGHNDPTQSLWAVAAEQAEAITVTFMNDFLNSSAAEVFQPNLTNVFVHYGETGGVAFHEIVVSLGEAVDCEALSNVYRVAKEGFCCEAVSALYWALGCWVLIAWHFCCCGVPATIYSRKRLAKELWGKEYDGMNSKGRADDRNLPAPKDIDYN